MALKPSAAPDKPEITQTSPAGEEQIMKDVRSISCKAARLDKTIAEWVVLTLINLQVNSSCAAGDSCSTEKEKF